MKKLLLLVLVGAMSFILWLVPGSGGGSVVATGVSDFSGIQLVQDALELLKFRYTAMTGIESELPTGVVEIIKDEDSFFKSLEQNFPRSEVSFLRNNGFMFCVYKQVPIYIKPSADRWVGMLRLSEKDRQEAVAQLAAAFDHELVYHILGRNDNEEAGLAHELTSYSWFVGKGKAGLNVQAHIDHNSFLGSLKAKARNIETKNAVSKMAAKN